MVEVGNVYYPKPQVREYKVWREGNVFAALLIGILIILGEMIVFLLVDFHVLQMSLTALIGLLVYALFLFFLLEPSRVREIKQMEIRTFEKPVIREVYVERPRKKLNIPKSKFVGSTQTRAYHLRTCRFGKLIKNKYKLSDNSLAFFKKRKFKACKICMKKK